MDVVRITQALRQQQQPGRLHSSRGGNNTHSADISASSNEPIPIRRPTWDNTLNINTASATASVLGHEVSHMEQNNGASPSTSTSSSRVTPTSASPSSSFFNLPSPLSLAAGFFSGGNTGGVVASASSAATASGANMGEIESLLLRSMPMFGNLVSRD
ncbi:hypothetical protein BGZ80_009656 [Entomortierella chlamydospora]|uniref:Uncharacterized protein n=1 Tax=Entomortierella chlamydospora TaxID=101097 RepID=A0A9P6T0A7_9FUNG|nr:hypothetical protein BGZ79_010811 [Entomortierella chlamydospora]KAG0015750.1 hypothetical protein BGZ80_009656 [Entomortierella chlamydospora]